MTREEALNLTNEQELEMNIMSNLHYKAFENHINKIYDYFEKKTLQGDTSSFEHQVCSVLDKDQ